MSVEVLNAELDAVNHARDNGRALLGKWMDAAEKVLQNPEKLSGRELNRAGELLIAANTWLRDEAKRLEKELTREQRIKANPWPTKLGAGNGE